MSELPGEGGANRNCVPGLCGIVFLEYVGWAIPDGKGELVLRLHADKWVEVGQARLCLEHDGILVLD